MAQLEEKRKDPHLRELQRKIIEADLEHYRVQALNIQKFQEQFPKKDWLQANYFPGCTTSLGFINAAQSYIACPVNMWHQALSIEKKVIVDYGRMGVISDMRNGWFSYLDLATMLRDDSALSRRIDELIQVRDKIIKTETVSSTNKQEKHQYDAITMALTYLLELKEAIQAKDSINIQLLMRQREIVLEQQLLVYIDEMLISHLDCVRESVSNRKPIHMVHIGLLDMSRISIYSHGWKRDEKVQMEDMSSIFEKFNGKMLVFDGSGPRIDSDKIHLSIKIAPPATSLTETQLLMYFFNTSVEGDVKNSGPQYANNKKNLENFLQRYPKTSAPWMQDLLNPKKPTSYQQAAEIASWFIEWGAVVSFGCLSAKDRGGVLGEILMQRPLKKTLKLLHQNEKKFLEKHLFHSKGTALQIASANGYSALKARLPFLPISIFSKFKETVCRIIRKVKGTGIDDSTKQKKT